MFSPSPLFESLYLSQLLKYVFQLNPFIFYHHNSFKLIYDGSVGQIILVISPVYILTVGVCDVIFLNDVRYVNH